MALGRPNSGYRLGPGMAFAGMAVLAASGVFGQPAISARAGLITAVVGEAQIEGRRVPQGSRNPTRGPRSLRELREGQTLTTYKGRVELLLGPDVYLRLDESSILRLEKEALEEATAELQQGVALIEVVSLPRDVAVQIHIADSRITLQHPGLYRFETDPGNTVQLIEVYGGEVTVSRWTKPASAEADVSSGISKNSVAPSRLLGKPVESASLEASAPLPVDLPGVRVTKGKSLLLAPNGEAADPASAAPYTSPIGFDRHLKRSDPLHMWSVDRSFALYNAGAVGKQHHWNATLRNTLFNDYFDVERQSGNAARIAMPPSSIDTQIRDASQSNGHNH